MRKQMLTLGALTILLLACIGGYFGIKGWNQKKTEAGQEAQGVCSALTVEQEDITAFSYQTQEGTVELVRTGDTWSIAEHGEIPVEETAVHTMTGYLSDLTAQEKLEEPYEDAVYGLTEPSNVITVQTPGGAQTLLVGDYNELNDCYYVKREGDAAVYTVYAYLVESFSKTPEELCTADTAEQSEPAAAETQSAETTEPAESTEPGT